MSESESRILSWPGPPGPGRPPSGPWPPGPLPPGPGPFPQPPDVFSAFAWLAKNYREAQAAKEFLKILLADIIANDPTFLANAHATVGVTDGSGAQQGMVGEIMEFPGAPVSYTTTYSTTVTSMGVLPPGDWDIWAWTGFTTPMQVAQLDNSSSNDPTVVTVPAGVSYISGAIDTSATETITLMTTRGWARIAAPSLMTLRLIATGTSAGTSIPLMAARRMR